MRGNTEKVCQTGITTANFWMAVLAAIQTALDDGINDVSANLAQQGSDCHVEDQVLRRERQEYAGGLAISIYLWR
jgi:hypothetical protein